MTDLRPAAEVGAKLARDTEIMPTLRAEKFIAQAITADRLAVAERMREAFKGAEWPLYDESEAQAKCAICGGWYNDGHNETCPFTLDPAKILEVDRETE